MKSDKGIILILLIIFLCILPFFYLHQGLLLIDTGREFYIPQQIISGNVLYKDIFNIYGALSYQINALLFLIFGQKISVLALGGVFNSIIILITGYFLSREFLNKSISFLYSLVICFALIFQTFLYNSNFPYSFAITYALSSFLLSLLFLIKYTKTQKSCFMYISCFFAGISIANKYEFILYPVILAYVLKDTGLKNGIKALICFICAPLISYSLLIFQGLNLNDVKISIELINNLINAPLIKQFFYKTSLNVLNNGISGIFAVLPVINIILLFIKRNEIIKNKPLFILILSAIVSCFKSFFVLNVNHMGIFLFPLCFLAFLAILNIKYQKFIPFILTACILIFSAGDFYSLEQKDYFLITPKGDIYTYKKDGDLINQAAGYIFENTKDTDRVVIMPEGSIINFITDRKGDNMYYNLSPLFYYDVFGEKRIIEHFSKNLPEYFVILPIDNREYGFSFFGKDYAQNFYEMILQNYNLVFNKNGVKIFKINS